MAKKLQSIINRWHFDTLRCCKEEMAHKTWRQALWWLAGGQSRFQPRFVLNQISSKAKDLKLWLYSKAKKSRSQSLKEDLANLSENSLQMHAEAYEGGH